MSKQKVPEPKLQERGTGVVVPTAEQVRPMSEIEQLQSELEQLDRQIEMLNAEISQEARAREGLMGLARKVADGKIVGMQQGLGELEANRQQLQRKVTRLTIAQEKQKQYDARRNTPGCMGRNRFTPSAPRGYARSARRSW